MKICVQCFDRYPDEKTNCEKDGGALMQLGDTTRLPLIGTIAAGRFLILDIIATGGMGTIYKAHQLSMGRMVALKLLGGNDLRDPEFVERFIREARATAQLRSPHTIVLHDFGRCDDSSMFIAMELLHGESIDNLIKSTPMHPARVRRLMMQVCLSLEEAHAHGLVHRDIKPSNIMVEQEGTPDEFVKVLDFGLVKIGENVDPNAMALTRPGTIHGTPPYMAPEMWSENSEIGPAVDIYAVGATMYEMLAGKRAFNAKSIPGLLQKHVNEPAPHLEHPALAPFDTIIQRCLAKKVEDRYPSVKALRNDLTRLYPEDGRNGLPPAEETDLISNRGRQRGSETPSSSDGTWRMDGGGQSAAATLNPAPMAATAPMKPQPGAALPATAVERPMAMAVATEPGRQEVIAPPRSPWMLAGAAAVLVSAIAFAIIVTTPTETPVIAKEVPDAENTAAVAPPPPEPPPVVEKVVPPPPPPQPPPRRVVKRPKLSNLKLVAIEESNAQPMIDGIERELPKCKETLGGKSDVLHIHLLVKPDGSLSALRVKPDSDQSKRFTDCLWAKLNGMKLKPFEGAGFATVMADFKP